MITNGTIFRIDSPSGANGFGELAWTTGVAINCRCAGTDIRHDAPPGGVKADGSLRDVNSATLQVMESMLQVALKQAGQDPGLVLIEEMRMLVKLDLAGPQRFFRVREVGLPTKGPLSFWSLKCVKD